MIASSAAVIAAGGVSKLLARMANTSGSPDADVTYPDVPRTLVIDPVFARALPSAAVPFIRFASDQSRPAIGSDAANGPLSDSSCATCVRIAASASTVT